MSARAGKRYGGKGCGRVRTRPGRAVPAPVRRGGRAYEPRDRQGSPRRARASCLKRLRELMAEALEPQERLDRIVREIAQNMVAEVCSLYVLRADSVLELYATEGLNPGSVHLAQLRLGEGLVGTIAASARPLNLSDAQNHPAFAYLPETGEEIYHSFLGVPVLRAGRTLGVLVVQNRTMRQYREEEMEALETIAMVIAEMVASGELSRLTRPGLELDLSRPVTFEGMAFNDGIGLGHVVLHEPRVVVTNLFNEDSDAELERLEEALGSLRLSIDDMLSRREIAFDGEHREVLEAYRMFANDRGWVRRLEEAMRNGLTAEAAVEKVQSDMRARMLHMTDPYLRERMSDFDDLANRLLRLLVGQGPEAMAERCRATPSWWRARWGRRNCSTIRASGCAGWCWRKAPLTSHVVIVARAIGIPVTGQMIGAVSMSENGDAIIIDGDEGVVHLRPQPDVEAAYAEKVKFRARRQELYRELRDKPAETLDGVDDRADDECGAGRRPAAARRIGRGRHRPFPHRTAVHGGGHLPARGGAGKALSRGAQSGRRQAGHLPHHRYRRRQGAALFQGRRTGGESGARLAGDPAGARPAGAAAHAVPRAAEGAAGGRELKLMLPMVTEISEISRRARCSTARSAPVALRRASADPAEARRDDRGAGAAVAARRTDGGGGFRLGRLQRPVPVRGRHRSRQHAAGRPVRPDLGAVHAAAAPDRAGRRRARARR
jgi:phosphotransferase system, enzyme I, PtsP